MDSHVCINQHHYHFQMQACCYRALLLWPLSRNIGMDSAELPIWIWIFFFSGNVKNISPRVHWRDTLFSYVNGRFHYEFNKWELSFLCKERVSCCCIVYSLANCSWQYDSHLFIFLFLITWYFDFISSNMRNVWKVLSMLLLCSMHDKGFNVNNDIYILHKRFTMG